MRSMSLNCSVIVLLLLVSAAPAADTNRLTHLDEFCDPYYVGLDAPKLVTPQWVGEPGVEAVIVLSIDDLREPVRHENFLRPIIERLKKIDGRAPVSCMGNKIDVQHPLFQQWLKEGLSIEPHTYHHPCPCLQGSDFDKAKATFDQCIDQMFEVPNSQPVAFRMPCCDSMNSMSPRFYAEIFDKTTPGGHFLRINSSVFMLFTPNDPALPRAIVRDEEGRQRFDKYVPRNRQFVNYIEDYPYPYVVARLCWELPSVIPDDWQGFNLHKSYNPMTVRDLKAAIDATVIKQGEFTLTHHAGPWIRNDQVIELIDHAVGKYGKKVKFLNFREVHERLVKNLLGGVPLRAANGQDNGVRIADFNGDGYMDVVIGNEQVRQTRIWSPEKNAWSTTDFPVQIVTVDSEGNRRDAGVRFGVVQNNGCASFLVRNEKNAGLWHFDGREWVADPQGLTGLELGGPVMTSRDGRDRGVRLCDLDLDGTCELIVGNPQQQGVFAWSAVGQAFQPAIDSRQAGKPAPHSAERHGWQKLPFTLPPGTTIVDAQGRDAGLRLVDVDEDGHRDVVFSNAERYSLHVCISMTEGWSRKILGGEQSDRAMIPMIVRADGTNNGAWFKYRHLWVQNEETGGKEVPSQSVSRSYTSLLDGDTEPPGRSPADSARSLIPRPGFKVELMAAEPLVMDPVDIAWGPDGKAWVAEMTDYPLGMAPKGHIGPPNPLGKPGGRVRFLEDTDGDGRYDRSTVFLEPVGFPSGVMPWRNGVIITAAPETFYAEDTNGDGKADIRRTLFAGFREGNQQHRVNHPRWGLDNWVHLANGDSGGRIRSAKTGETVNIGGRDLRTRPDEGLLDPEAGQSQYGRNRDDWGNWFGCNNSNPGWHYAVADHYMRRNPHVAAPPSRIDVTSDRSSYPAGRVITHCFIPQPTPREGTPGRWTSLAGVTIYRDDLFGPEYTGNLFVGDSVYNVVHRRILTPQGVTFRGERAADEQRSEFLGSADPWFRTASLKTGPDGALWVVDLYRFVIEHPEWIVPELTNRLELRRFCDKGRIYRIYPVDKKPRTIPRLDKLDTAGLVAALDHPNGWQRDMAQQMLLWRGDKSAVPLLEALAKNSKRALARLHALCTLDGLGALRPEIVIRGLADEHPGVRRHAIRLSESLVASSPPLGEALLKLADDPDPQVQLQLAYSLGEWNDPRAGRLLGHLAIRHAADPYLSAAVMSSAVPHVAAMLAEVRSASNPAASKLAGQLQKLATAIKARPELTAAKGKEGGGALVHPIEASRQEVERLLGGIATAEQLQKAFDKYSPVLTMYGDPERGKNTFVEATCSTCHLFQDIGQRIGPDLATLVDRSPKTLLTAVIDPNRGCIDRYVEHVAITNNGLIYSGMLLEETGNSITLADGEGKRKVILRKDLEQLIFTGRTHMPEGLANGLNLQQMADLFAFIGGREPPPKQLPGNEPQTIVRGADTAFTMPAAAAAIYGPDIQFDAKTGSVMSWTSPRAYVAWPFKNFVMGRDYEVWIEYACGDNAAGNPCVVEIGNGQSVRAKVTGTGGRDNYRRLNIGQVKIAAGTYRLAVRPEEPLNGALMNLRSVKLVPIAAPARTASFRNAPEKVKQGEDRTIELLATQAEVHGPGVVFESRYGNLGCWYRPEGYGEWAFEVRQGGAYELWLDWACMDPSAGNRFQVQVDKAAVLEGTVPGTGTWDNYRRQKFGQTKIDPGSHTIIFRAGGAIKFALIDLRGIKLVPVEPQKEK